MDPCFELARQLMARLTGRVDVVDETQGFRYFDQRDLLGFVDGGVYTEAGFQATVEAGWAALAPLQQACVLPVSTS